MPKQQYHPHARNSDVPCPTIPQPRYMQATVRADATSGSSSLPPAAFHRGIRRALDKSTSGRKLRLSSGKTCGETSSSTLRKLLRDVTECSDRWLAITGKLGGQRKIPRLSNDFPRFLNTFNVTEGNTHQSMEMPLDVSYGAATGARSRFRSFPPRLPTWPAMSFRLYRQRRRR